MGYCEPEKPPIKIGYCICGGIVYKDCGGCKICYNTNNPNGQFHTPSNDQISQKRAKGNSIFQNLSSKDYPPPKKDSSKPQKPKSKTGYVPIKNDNNGKKKNGNSRKASTAKVRRPEVVRERQKARAIINFELEEYYEKVF